MNKDQGAGRAAAQRRIVRASVSSAPVGLAGGVALALLIAGCGQKGPLRPPAGPTTGVVQPAVRAPAPLPAASVPAATASPSGPAAGPTPSR